MSDVLYIMPVITLANGDRNIRRPKYLTTNYSMSDFGYEGGCLVGCTVTPVEDVDITSHPDVFRFPDDLDVQVAGDITKVRTVLEASHIPAGWIVPGMTYRIVLRKVFGMIMFLQRICGSLKLYQPIIDGGVTLDTQFSDLPVNSRQTFQFAADSLGIDKSGFSGAIPLRHLLSLAGNQMDSPRQLRNRAI